MPVKLGAINLFSPELFVDEVVTDEVTQDPGFFGLYGPALQPCEGKRVVVALVVCKRSAVCHTYAHGNANTGRHCRGQRSGEFHVAACLEVANFLATGPAMAHTG